MKIYINNFNIDILQSIMDNLNELYIDSETYIQIYSVDGVYQVDSGSVNKLICVDNEIKLFNNYYKDFTPIVDTSYYKKEISNSIHPEHISTKIKRCFFKTNPASTITLVIESDADNGIPNEIYFEIDKYIDINDTLIKRELIEFFSLLN
jgi:hypothetical protein